MGKGKPLSVYLDEDIIAAVQTIADKQERSFSSTLNKKLKEVLKLKGLIK